MQSQGYIGAAEPANDVVELGQARGTIDSSVAGHDQGEAAAITFTLSKLIVGGASMMQAS